MSVPVCTSRVACFLNGLFGTAVVLCVLGVVWAGFDAWNGFEVRETLLLLPALAIIALAVVLKLRRQPAGTMASTSAILAAVWTVVALNSGISL